MYNIRHYDSIMHPDHFKVGLLGLLIRVLNAVRWRLEVLVQRLVLRYLSKEGGLPKERAGAVSKLFDLDVRAERLEKDRTSPRLPEVSNVEIPRAERYLEGGSIVRSLEAAEEQGKGLPIRPLPMDDMIARYMNPRRARYSKGRKRVLVADETDFEPVIKEANNG